MMVLSVISMSSYLEKVGTLLVVACEDTSAVCMMNNLALEPVGPPPILALSQRCCCAYTALSAAQTSQTGNLGTVGCSRAPPLCVRKLNGLWDFGGQASEWPMTSEQCQENVPLSISIVKLKVCSW